MRKSLAFLEAQERSRVARPQAAPALAAKARFSPKWLKLHRNRLKLSAHDYARLLGVSGQTVYHWEQGRARPRKAQIAAWVAVRRLGRREALKRLEMLAPKPR
jgi:DNA-binding transcriptional regulator YiaG